MMAAQSIAGGDADIIVAGGTENMSLAPFVLPKARFGYRMGEGKLVDSMINEGLWCAMNDYHMGITAENIAEQWGLTREEQDQFSCISQNRAEKAIRENRFADEIIPVPVPVKGGVQEFAVDEFPKMGTTMETLGRLKPAFKKDGTVTAGNASGINDGAGALVVMWQKKLSVGYSPLAKFVTGASAGVDPSIMGIGPIDARRKLWKKQNGA
jgi:acetyl-CoA C-acetyltransferase